MIQRDTCGDGLIPDEPETSKLNGAPRRRSGSGKRPKRSKAPPAKRPPAAPDDGDNDQEELPCANAAELRETKTSWLLPGLLPLGSVAVLEGRKEAGKSSLAAAIAAAVAGGPALPGCRRRPAAPVIWFSGEEHVPSTTLPKLRAAGADLGHVFFPGWDTRGLLSRPWLFPADLPRLERLMAGCAARLCVLDPLASYVASGLNLCVEQEARGLLDQLGRLAANTDSLVLLIRHLRKSSAGHMHDHGLGSIAIGAVARAVVRVDTLEDPRGRRVLRPVACNLGPPAKPLTFDLEAAEGAARVLWRGAIDRDDPRLGEDTDDPGERDAFEDAQAFLLKALDGGDQPAKDLVRMAEEAAISRATLRRAKKALRVKSLARGNAANRVWYWRKPSV